MTNAELVSRLMERCGINRKNAGKLLQDIREIIIEGLRSDAKTTITGLGTFYLKLVKQGTGVQGRIKFKTSDLLKDKFRRIQRKGLLEKYGVVTDKASDKAVEARISGKCPDCGRDLPKDGPKMVLVCPECGSKPFEVEEKK